jgi:hypothetical protein
MFEFWLMAVLGNGRAGGSLYSAVEASQSVPAVTAAAAGAGAAEAATAVSALMDPIALLRETGGPLVTPLIDAFTFLAVLTSAIAFILGLSGFFQDALKVRCCNDATWRTRFCLLAEVCSRAQRPGMKQPWHVILLLQLPASSQQPLPYVLTVVPPLACAVLFPGAILALCLDFAHALLPCPVADSLRTVCPSLSSLAKASLPLCPADIFFSAVAFAGTFGILPLFGIIPAAMVWSERYGDGTMSRVQIVPGGRPALLLVGGIAAGIIGREVLLSTGLM